ncbi:LuxR C-terminal-related transcriptional regulator [Nonomuraea sp. NPDC050556]|uniref:helix-turn-helix transcriptional regulator n=1 Tax=Nonomuraea sp. NPDC050556 TaxID=3364369 RepID=UPI00379F59BB
MDSLDAVLTLLRAPAGEILRAVSAVLQPLVPHRALAMLTGDCFRSPLILYGEPELTSAELGRLAATVAIGTPRYGRAETGPVLLAASAPQGSAGSLLAVVLDGDAVPDEPTMRTVQQLWDITVIHVNDLASTGEPVYLAETRAAASERASAMADLVDAHAATLTALLATLRSRNLDDATARRTVTDMTASSLIELRTGGERHEGDETAAEAFARLSEQFTLLARYSDVRLELVPPERGGRPLPREVAQAGAATVRGSVLTMLDQGGAGRIRAAWLLEEARLVVTVRDDGPGTLSAEALAVHRLADRLASLEGTLAVDAVPGWGTTITASIPLAPPEVPDAHPLTALNPRELDVLGELSRGHRNQTIAQHLGISPHTVKFHVANILGKLGVGSRGEAAAVARDAGVRVPDMR